MKSTPSSSLSVAVVCLVAASSFGQGAAGVSDERMRLPGAPGSISGVGENASVEGNQGGLQYQIAIEVPPGFVGVTPAVNLSYSSSGGAGLSGMGWSLPTYSIERSTSKGLQKYDLDDRFVVDGSSELVRVSQTATSAVYRTRFEGSFVRYSWLALGTGEDGYWKAEYPDGRTGYFGADAAGVPALTAQVRVPTTAKTFRWHLVAMTDAWGHAMKLSWTKDGSGTPLLERIDYLYEGATPRHSVRFTYEPRAELLSDARPGFDLRLTQRLKDVRIFSGTTAPEQIGKYVLDYQTDAEAGGATRLKSVSRFGRGDVPYPVKFSFDYSKTLGGACAGTCEKPFVKDMGTVAGVDFNTGRASLVDINGDALPDVLYSDTQGRHQFFYAKLDGEGKASWDATSVMSTKTVGSSAFILGDPKVQLIDVNGDGFMDLTQAKLPAVLCNNGSGDWVDASFCTGSAPGLPGAVVLEDDAADVTQADPKFIRFFDYDNDKRIDWLRTQSGGTTTEVMVNTPAGFIQQVVSNIGAAFDESPLQLADMNGDGMQDPVQVLVSGAAVSVQYKLNLGYGNWAPASAWTSVVLSGLNASQAAVAELQDVNGDGLADVVAVTGNQVAVALNRNGDRFDAVITLTSAELGSGTIPARGTTTVVVFADMNGNGSDDIVWIQANGNVQYLELYPVRPNLISRIDNGIGAVQLVSYGTSIVEQGRDFVANQPWLNRVPNPMTVVTRVDTFVTLTGTDSGGLRESTHYRYHSGYYDGVEKQFRGYEGVDRVLVGDNANGGQEPGVFVLQYDVGKSNAAFAGLELKQSAWVGSGTALALLREDRTLYEICPVAQVPATTVPPIVFACSKASTTVLVERGTPANALTTKVEREYDGYGNVVRQRNLGVTNKGTPEAATACEACTTSGSFGKACGPTCTGDENFAENDFIVPGADTSGAWRPNLVRRTAEGGVATLLGDETLYFYDGPEFVGLPAGKATLGGTTRVSRRSGPGAADFLDVDRLKLDAHGNVAELIAPNGTVANTGNWRRIFTFEAAGVHLLQLDLRLNDAAGNATVLRRELRADTTFEVVSQASSWFAVVAGAPASTPQLTRYRYDEHGRMSSILDPADTDANPSKQLTYALADPASKVVMSRRSVSTGPQDLLSTQCFDGKGRPFQTRTRLADNRWQVSGFSELDVRGAVVRSFQPYIAATGDCEKTTPASVLFVKHTFDPLGRPLTETEPDGAMRRNEYAPLAIRHFDERANDSTSPTFNVPVIQRFDGDGRLVAIERYSKPEGMGAAAVTQLEYDSDGNLAVVRDPTGSLHTQSYNDLGRMVKVVDTNSGTTLYEYDNNGNETKRTDGRGKVTISQYDTASRLIARWDEADPVKTKVTWLYDLKPAGCTECTNLGGQLAQTVWPSAASERLGYDAKNNLLYRERIIDGRSFVTRQKFDTADRKTSTTYPGGLAIDSVIDGNSKPTSIKGYLTSIEYDDRGDLKTVVASNGVSTGYTRDDRREVKTQKATGKDGVAFLDLGYSLDKSGNLLAITDGADRAGKARHAAAFTYDAWKRVSTVALERTGAAADTLSFTYGDNDNIKSKTSSLGAASPFHLGDYTYDPMKVNAVSKAGAIDYSYDAMGALATRGDLTYSRDFLGRLTSVSKGGAVTGDFSYTDGFERLRKQEGDSTTLYLGDDFEVQDGISTLYVTLEDRKVARAQSDALAALVLSDLAPATASGTTLTPTGDTTIDIADAWLAQAAAVGAVTLSGGPTPSPVKALLRSSARRLLMTDVTWLHTDHLESVVAASNGAGQVSAEQSFSPFGEVRSRTAFVDSSGFQGQELEESTGLLHFEFRDLDPATGRWSDVDPAFEQLDQDNVKSLGEATSAYALVGNNFANEVDPTGLTSHGKSGGPPKLQRSNAKNSTMMKADAKAAREKVRAARANKGKGKPTKFHKAGRVVQAMLALASVATAIAAAVESSNSSLQADSSGNVTPDAHGTLAVQLTIGSTVLGGTATAIGTGFDLQSAFGGGEKKKAGKTPDPGPRPVTRERRGAMIAPGGTSLLRPPLTRGTAIRPTPSSSKP